MSRRADREWLMAKHGQYLTPWARFLEAGRALIEQDTPGFLAVCRVMERALSNTPVDVELYIAEELG